MLLTERLFEEEMPPWLNGMRRMLRL